MHDLHWSRAEQAERVKENIWRFVSPASDQVRGVAPIAATLLQLPRRDLQFLASLHLLLSPETDDLLGSAPGLLRHLTTSTTTPLDEHPERIRGPVDWAATLAASGVRGRRYAFATRPVERDYATPENRLLVGSLKAVADAAHTLTWGPAKSGIGVEVLVKSDHARRLLGAPVVRNIVGTPHPRDPHRVERGRAARRFKSVSAFWRLHESLQRLEDREVLRSMVERAALVTSSDGAMLEVLVLFDVLDGLRSRGWKSEGLDLVRGQVRVAHHRSGDRLDVYYQGVPSGLPNRYRDVLKAHGVPLMPLRPDLLLDKVTASGERALALVEVKYRGRVDQAIRAATFDLLAYKANYLDLSSSLRLIGVGWGGGLEPQRGAEIALCTPDRIFDAVSDWDAP